MSLLAAAWDIWRARRHGPQGITARQEPRLQDTVDWARARSPLYRKLYDSLPRGDVELSLLPPVTKNQLMAAFDKWVTDPAVTRAGVDALYNQLSQSRYQHPPQVIRRQNEEGKGEEGSGQDRAPAHELAQT